jgi:hypothetical protein
MHNRESQSLVRLATAPNPVLAHVWEQALRDEGIESKVLAYTDFVEKASFFWLAMNLGAGRREQIGVKIILELCICFALPGK